VNTVGVAGPNGTLNSAMITFVVPLVLVFTLVSVESPVITFTPDSWWRLHEAGILWLRGLLRRHSLLSGFSRTGSLSIRIVHDDPKVNRFIRRSSKEQTNDLT
jgi:hypothetical protein